MIYERVWGHDISATSNSLDVYVGYLRRKTEEGGEPRLIHTVRGVGFRLGPDMSYRRRLMLLAALAVALAVVLASVATYVSVRAQLRDSVDDGLRSLSASVGTAPEPRESPTRRQLDPEARAPRASCSCCPSSPLGEQAGYAQVVSSAGRIQPPPDQRALLRGRRRAWSRSPRGRARPFFYDSQLSRHATCACTSRRSPRARRCRRRARSRTSTPRCGG